MAGGLALFFTFGAIIGSFLNVVILRYGTKSITGRSLCLSCGRTLSWYELIPLVSFLSLRGRCRTCGARISWQYPLVELATGLIFAAVLVKTSLLFPPLSFWSMVYCLLSIVLWSLLIVIAVYDLRHQIIPDRMVYSFLFLSLLFLVSRLPASPAGGSPLLSDLLGGFALALPFALIWLLSRGRAMGLGDAKLVVGFPWFLGLWGGLSAVIFGFWMGATVALLLLWRKGNRLTMKTELPLAPFLIAGLLIVYLSGFVLIYI